MRLPLASFLGTDHEMNLYQRVYLAGYSGRVLPRWLRRLAARSALGFLASQAVSSRMVFVMDPRTPIPALPCRTAEPLGPSPEDRSAEPHKVLRTAMLHLATE